MSERTAEPMHRPDGALSGLLRDLTLDPRLAWTSRRPVPWQRSWLVLPSVRRPQVLVPATRGGARIVEQRMAKTRRARFARWSLATLMRTGLSPWLPLTHMMSSDTRIEDLSRWTTGRGDVTLGFLFGPNRANRKPVIRILAENGRTLAYAKVGVNDLTRQLVHQEAESLGRLAAMELPGIRIPQVLRFGEWGGLDVLVTSPLADSGGERHPLRLPLEATRGLMGIGARDGVPLGEFRVFDSGDRVAAGTDAGGRVESYRVRLLALVGNMPVRVGAAHGDWTPWNMAKTENGLEVWDWERFETDVPQGLDVVHFAFSDHMPSSGEMGAGRLERIAALLSGCGIDPASADALLSVYLLMMAQRYLADLDIHRAPLVEQRLKWVLRALSTQLDKLEGGGLP